MIMYDPNRPLDESVEAATNIFGETPTPAHYYIQQNNLNSILEDMMSGVIPCGTGQPFPVIWKADIEQMSNTQKPPFDIR